MAARRGIWLGLTGVISVVLGGLIFSIVDLPTADALATPEAAQAWFQEWGWVIGLFIALELIAQGAALVGVSLAARKHGSAAVGGPRGDRVSTTTA